MSDEVIFDLVRELPNAGEYDFELITSDGRASLSFTPQLDNFDGILPSFLFTSVVYAIVTPFRCPLVVELGGSRLSLDALVKLGKSRFANEWNKKHTYVLSGLSHFQIMLVQKDTAINILAKSVNVTMG